MNQSIGWCSWRRNRPDTLRTFMMVRRFRKGLKEHARSTLAALFSTQRYAHGGAVGRFRRHARADGIGGAVGLEFEVFDERADN